MAILLEIVSRNPLAPDIYFTVAVITLLSSSRLRLSVWQSARVSAVDDWSTIHLQGLRIDIATLCILLLFPMAISILLSAPKRIFTLWKHSFMMAFVRHS